MFMVNSVFRKPQPWNDGSSGKLADRFDIGVGTIQTVIHEAAYGKVYAQWIPRLLTEDGLSVQYLKQYREQGDSFLHQ